MCGSTTNQHLHRSGSCRAAPDCREQKALLLLLLSPQQSLSAPRLAGTAPALSALRASAVTKQEPKKQSQEHCERFQSNEGRNLWDTALSWQGSPGSLICFWQTEPRGSAAPGPARACTGQRQRLRAVPRGWPASSSPGFPNTPNPATPSAGMWLGPGPTPAGCPSPQRGQRWRAAAAPGRE